MQWKEGADNPTTAFRAISGTSKSTRLETRVGGADINPYLGVAAALASGLYGIENNMSLDDAPIVGSGYAATDAVRLPRNLHEAAEKLAGSSVARARTFSRAHIVRSASMMLPMCATVLGRGR